MRRGVAAVAVAGGALSLTGAAAPVPADAGAAFVPAAARAPLPAAAAATIGDAQLLSSILPVTPEPPVVDATDLVKAVQRAEQEIARIAAEREAAEARAAEERAVAERVAAEALAAAERVTTGGLDCGLDTSALGAVKAHVLDAAEFLGCLFGEPAMHGVAGRAGTSDHPSGLAVDFMVDRSTGDALAACALRNQDALGITYVIWEQRINHGSGWEPMEDRGGVTANHFDHVHISFDSGGGGGSLGGC